MDEDASIFKNKFFSVFGLGDITYNNFNSVGLKVDKYLDDLGGRRILDVGIGSSHSKENSESTFTNWKKELLAKINILSSIGFQFESFREVTNNKTMFKVECIPTKNSDLSSCRTLECCKFGITPEFYKNLSAKQSLKKVDAHL